MGLRPQWGMGRSAPTDRRVLGSPNSQKITSHKSGSSMLASVAELALPRGPPATVWPEIREPSLSLRTGPGRRGRK